MIEKSGIQEVHVDEQLEKTKKGQTSQQPEGSQEIKLREDKNSKKEE